MEFIICVSAILLKGIFFVFVVIFEVYAQDGQVDTYFDMAAELEPLLLEQPGFISVERYQSLTERKNFSLSLHGKMNNPC